MAIAYAMGYNLTDFGSVGSAPWNAGQVGTAPVHYDWTWYLFGFGQQSQQQQQQQQQENPPVQPYMDDADAPVRQKRTGRSGAPRRRGPKSTCPCAECVLDPYRRSVAGHICPKCPSSFVRVAKLKQHIACVHLGLRPHRCTLCDRAFATPYDQRRHTKSVSTAYLIFLKLSSLVSTSVYTVCYY